MKKIAIVCGGDSGEYEISVKSAAVVKQHLNPKVYESWLVFITRKAWYVQSENNEKYQIDKNDFSVTIGGRHIVFDAVFNAIHGSPGENGLLNGYFELLSIPYTSSGLTT